MAISEQQCPSSAETTSKSSQIDLIRLRQVAAGWFTLAAHLPASWDHASQACGRRGSLLMPASCADETRRAPDHFGIAVATYVDVPRTFVMNRRQASEWRFAR